MSVVDLTTNISQRDNVSYNNYVRIKNQ